MGWAHTSLTTDRWSSRRSSTIGLLEATRLHISDLVGRAQVLGTRTGYLHWKRLALSEDAESPGIPEGSKSRCRLVIVRESWASTLPSVFLGSLSFVGKLLLFLQDWNFVLPLTILASESQVEGVAAS